MNSKNIVKLTNIIGSVAIFALLYWVFTFIVIEVFDLDIFDENITETFQLSIIGILALMLGALIINIMLNLTRIAEKENPVKVIPKKRQKWKTWVFMLSFPMILVLLWSGNYLMKRQKQHKLLNAAASLIQKNPDKNDYVLNYTFDTTWIDKTENYLSVLSIIDENFPLLGLIVRDSIDGIPIYLKFEERNFSPHRSYKKNERVISTSRQERTYLDAVFQEGSRVTRFEDNYGNSEFYYPYSKNGKTVVFYFAEHDRYGKF